MSERERPTAMGQAKQVGQATQVGRAGNSGAIAADPANDRLQSLEPTMVGAAIESPRFNSQPARDLRQSVELHIDELVLHGFQPAQRYAIGDAFERELARLFNERGVPPGTREAIEIAEVNAGTIHLSAGANDEATGRQLARAIYGGLLK